MKTYSGNIPTVNGSGIFVEGMEKCVAKSGTVIDRLKVINFEQCIILCTG